MKEGGAIAGDTVGTRRQSLRPVPTTTESLTAARDRFMEAAVRRARKGWRTGAASALAAATILERRLHILRRGGTL